MRFRLPDSCTGISHGGVMLDRAAADGTIQAEASAVADLAPHGILPIEEPASLDGTAAPARKGHAKR